jgi:NodT family efflux transporter outer membrane factor (OMF) lipoprotein
MTHNKAYATPRRNGLLASALLTIVFAGGCAVGPDYTAPELDSPAAWRTEDVSGLRQTRNATTALSQWWKVLEDPMLDSLMQRAVTGNLDLKGARARVRAARARLGISEADLYPTLDASGSLSTGQQSENAGYDGKERDLYKAGFDAGWEIDIFGGTRRAVEAAGAELEASEADLRDVYVSMLAEIASTYVDVRTYQTRLSVAQANLEEQKETYEIVASRYDSGLSDALGVQQARYSLESTRAEIPALQSKLDAAINRLALLLGQQPDTLHAELITRRPIPMPPVSVAVGIPADALRNRPDIRMAERTLAARTAEVGVATAELYPKFRLVGSIGLESFAQSSLFESGSQVYSFGPGISWPIFRAGAIRRNIDVAEAVQEQYLHRYQHTVLAALNEAQTAMTDYAKEQNRRDALQAATLAAREALELAQDKYLNGLVDFSDVLEARRSLLSYEDQLAVSKGAVVDSLVRIYKSMGGGWQTMEALQQTAQDAGSSQR